jgi:hypothetical protein
METFYERITLVHQNIFRGYFEVKGICSPPFQLIFHVRKAKKTSIIRRKYLPKKKKQKKRAPVPLPNEAKLLLTGLLEDFKAIAPTTLVSRIPDPQMAEALAENLPLDDPGAPDLLSEIGKAFPQKNVQSAVRKAYFKLKQRGIPVPDREPEKASALAMAKEEPSAYLGPIDGAGNRPLFIILPQRALGVDLAMGMVSDEQGIIEFIYGRYGRKRMREVKDLFFSRIPHMVETSLSHAATVLEHAYRKEEGKPSAPAHEYLRLRPWLLENVELLGRPAVADFIPLNSVTADLLTQTQIERLLRHELMTSWAVDQEKLRPLSEEIAKAEESPIFISEAQRREHINKIKGEGITKLLGEKDRSTFKTRLDEMAFIFFKIGEETLARLCLAAALSIEEETTLFKVNPFLNALVDRRLAQVRKHARSSPIILA